MEQRHGPSAETRERIVAGARDVLAAAGLGATTVQHVLERAGVSRRTFYAYFAGKEDVVRAVYEACTADLVDRIRVAIRDAEDPPRKVTDAMRAYLRFQEEGGALLMHLQAEAVRPESALAPRRRATLDALVSLVDDAVVGTLGLRVDPTVYRTLLIGIEGLVIQGQAERPFDEDDWRRVRHAINPMFLNVLAGPVPLPEASAPTFDPD